jgi:Uma2 family endonuclease
MSEGAGKREKNDKVKEQGGYYDIPERYEIIDGVRYDFLASPKMVHQRISVNLILGFSERCRLEGEIVCAPMDVHFDEDNIAEPDIIYIANENRGIVRDGFIFGVPDLLVEILSESTGRRDKTIKKAMYQKFGVPEFWIVDPVHRTVDQFLLSNGKYELIATLTDEDTISSPRIACLSIDLGKVFPPEEV